MRRYGAWAGRPKGIAEDPTLCVVQVFENGWPSGAHQCSFKRGKGPGGLYCGHHAKWTPTKLEFWTPPEATA